MRIDELLTSRDREVFKNGGYGHKMDLGSKPLFLVIDMTYEFTGPVREPILLAQKKVRTACGLEGWAAVDSVRRMLPHVRASRSPVIYTKSDKSLIGPFAKKNSRSHESDSIPSAWCEIVNELTPNAGEEVLSKVSPSAFFGTTLIYSLIEKGIDTIFVVGGTISGCVRATVTDAFSYGFKVAIVEEGVFDRGQASGAMSLFDMNAKLANVVTESEAIRYFEAMKPMPGRANTSAPAITTA